MDSFVKARRIVVKVGTSTLTYATGNLNIRQVEVLCKTLADIKNSGVEVILVSSGAISVGVGKLRLPGRPEDTPSKQAAAAVGQCELMAIYDRQFMSYNLAVAQLLLIRHDVEDEKRRANVINTLSRLLQMGAVPIINENDTVATEEIEFGDNDSLSAIVAALAGADALVILSDIDGLFTADPRKDPSATLIGEVHRLTPEIRALAGDAGSERGTGGMVTKIHAAQICHEHGINMAIINGERPETLYDLLEGKSVGTRFIWE